MILMNDFTREPPEVRTAILEAVQRVSNSGWYILGKEVEQFENLWAKLCGTNYGVGVGNGLDAIEIALRSLDIGKGDEVITTPMTAFATVLAILRSGATPVLADIESDTALLSLDSVQRCISPRTKAIILVHLYGHLRNMSSWCKFCETHQITLVEDCAQSHLAQWQGQYAGSFGKVGAYSFYPTKNLGALGDAGMLVTNTDKIAHAAQKLRNYGQSKRYYHPQLGMNSRLDELQAAILAVKLPFLSHLTQQRKKIASLYFQELNNPHISLLSPAEEKDAHVYHLFVITCQYRDLLHKHLKQKGIQTLIHYPIPINQQKSCKDLNYDPKGLSNSDKHAETCLSLPCHPYMTEYEIFSVIEGVNSFTP